MRTHLHVPARWSVSAALLLLVTSLAPSLTFGVSSRTSPLASPMASPAPVVRPLDLAAMALTPIDLDNVGLTGFGQQTSEFLTLEEQVEQLVAASSLGKDAEAIRAGLSGAGFQRRYQRQLGLPSRPGAPPSRLRTFVAPYVIEYASIEGAAAGFALLETEASDAGMKDVPGTGVIGDHSEITRFRRVSDHREPYRALDLTFQVDNLVAGVTVGEFGGREPDLSTVEALGELLLGKARRGQTGSSPGLSNLAQRLADPDIETRSDEYGRLDGQTLPNFGETPDEFADRAERYGDAIAVYGVGQSIDGGSPARTDDTRYGVSLYQFAGEQDAAAWLEGGVERAEQLPYVIEAVPVAGAATIGDASATLAITTERSGAGTAQGYLVEAQVGIQTAQVQVMGIVDVPLAAVEELARLQVTCLRAGSCLDRVPLPAGLLKSEVTPVASPGPGGPSSTPQSCSPTDVSAGTPVAGTPQPLLPVPETGKQRTTEASTSPNIIVILTDDLDARSVACLPNVQTLLAAQGVTFANAFVTTPLCCPSRASILRGQYAHSHGVLNNVGDNGGFQAFYRLGDEESTVATWLQDAGYRTALVGKYLNRYPKGAPESHVPPGWDAWTAFASSDEDEGGSNYSGYALNEDGTTVLYGQQPSEYSTDVLTAKATDFIDRAATSGAPFFLYLAPFAPHGPSTPASRHTAAFAEVQAPRIPSFGEADVDDKPAWVQALPALNDEQSALLDDRYRRRLRSLLAVDEMVASLIETLDAAGALENTYIVFTSDNGYHLGEHGLPLGKQSPYDESLRVPLLVRGPGVPPGAVVDGIALNIDLAPTFAELAGASPADFVDGRSLVPLLDSDPPAAWRHGFLVEHYDRTLPSDWSTPGPITIEEPSEDLDEFEEGDEVNGITPIDSPPYLALRTEQYLYVEYAGGERELYDLHADPYQLQNLATTADPALLAELAANLDHLRLCAGADCRAAEDALPGVPAAG